MVRPRICSVVVVTVLAGFGAAASSEADGHARSNAFAESWQRSYVSPRRPTVIKVAYLTSPDTRLDHAKVVFTRRRVAVTVYVGGPPVLVTSAVVRCASVRMGERLRGRRRIDGATHRHPNHRNEAPLMRNFKLRKAHCPSPKVRRRHRGRRRA
jgi:hypothetical protein